MLLLVLVSTLFACSFTEVSVITWDVKYYAIRNKVITIQESMRSWRLIVHKALPSADHISWCWTWGCAEVLWGLINNLRLLSIFIIIYTPFHYTKDLYSAAGEKDGKPNYGQMFSETKPNRRSPAFETIILSSCAFFLPLRFCDFKCS